VSTAVTSWRDTLERLFWTFVASFLASVLGSPVMVAVTEELANVSLDLSAWKLAVIGGVTAGLTSTANAVLIVARHRLTVLPSPGEGLPGLPVPQPEAPDLPPPDAGRIDLSAVLFVAALAGAAVVLALTY
jgi:hypothetical protein